MNTPYELADFINLFVEGRIAEEDAARQMATAHEILQRLEKQPGLILADEVGMGKTFVALSVAVSIAVSNRGKRPVVVMVPPALKEKWPRDFELFTRWGQVGQPAASEVAWSYSAIDPEVQHALRRLPLAQAGGHAVVINPGV